MTLRASLLAIFLAVFLFAGCSADPAVTSIDITPSMGQQVLSGPGQTVQFHATATFQRGQHPATRRDVTNEVEWRSSVPAVATIDSNGLATTVGVGTTVITATMNGSSGSTTGTSNVQVSGGAVHDLTSLSIIPGSGQQTLTTSGETAQFIAVGTFSGTPSTMDMTNQVTWKSSDIGVATINSMGLATAGTISGKTTITAVATSTSGATITGVSDLTTSGGGVGKLPTLTIYPTGLGTGTVTSSPAGISCTSGSGCTGNFQLNATVTLTAVPAAGSAFGGWSSNCAPANQTTCTITMSNNDTVGVIFNH